MKVGQEIAVELEAGKTLFVKLKNVSPINDQGYREVVFDLNGTNRIVKVLDEKSGVKVEKRIKADPRISGHIPAPMPGVVFNVKVKVGDKVTKGDPLVVLSAMKMETNVVSAISGKVKALHVVTGTQVAAGDLIVEIEN